MMPPMRMSRFHSRSFCTTRQLSSGSQLTRSLRDCDSSHSDCSPCFVWTDTNAIHGNRVEWCIGHVQQHSRNSGLRPLPAFHHCLLFLPPRWTRQEKQCQAHRDSGLPRLFECVSEKASIQLTPLFWSFLILHPLLQRLLGILLRSLQFSKAYNLLCPLARSSQAQHILESTEEHHHLHVKQNQTHKEVNLGGCDGSNYIYYTVYHSMAQYYQ